MKISAKVSNDSGKHSVMVSTNSNTQQVSIPAKENGSGSGINGGEILFLAIATCYCNDIYREAAKRNITVEKVEVVVEGEFGSEGEPAKNIVYNAKVKSNSDEKEIIELMKFVDTVAEIHNTLRIKNEIKLNNISVL
jgi:uncharacterized OsmC-like protein